MVKKFLGLSGVFLLTFFFSVSSFGQSRKERKANKFFDSYAYVDAIKIYKSMAEKGWINTSILSKLGDSYYFNGKFVEAYKWYYELFEGNYTDKNTASLDREYYYRYAQTLKAVYQVEKSDAILEQFAVLASSDSRARLFVNKDSLVDRTLASSRFFIGDLKINSAYSDYGGTVLSNQLIFTSSRVNNQIRTKVHNWTNQPYTQLYVTSIAEDGTLESPVLFAKEIASKDLNMSTAVFTKDKNTMYFTSNSGSTHRGKNTPYTQEASSLLKIYQATKQEDGTWGSVVTLPINEENFNSAHPALTPDGEWMYFVSDRQGSLGQSDLFRVKVSDMNRFGSVEHLGDRINTAGRETFPFISSENVLYFSSDGHPGFGGLDVYKSKINVDGTLGKIVNLGPDINTAFDDFGFYIDAQTKRGFITKSDAQGGDTMYLFTEEPCTLIINGLLSTTETKEKLANVEITIFNSQRKKVDVVYSNELGYYSSDKLDCGNDYHLRLSKAGYLTREFIVHTNRNMQQRLDVELNLTHTAIEAGDDLVKKLDLAPIYFDFDKATIRAEAQIELMKIVEVMVQYPELKIDIRSHTDSRGDEVYNQKLSEHRAKATMQWMIRQGIESHRLTSIGYGNTQLLNRCGKGISCSESEHQANRRSEFIIQTR